MIERMDLFLPPRSQYQVLQSFTYSLAEALLRTRVSVRVLEAEKENPQSFIDTILNDRPECTLSFNGLLPDAEGHFFCDLIGIPHVACLVDGPQHFMQLTKSKNTVITCVDRFACDFLQGVGFQNVLFMPHAVDQHLFIEPELVDRPHDAILLASYLDYEAIEDKWRHNSPLGQIWKEAAQYILEDKKASCAQAIAKAMDANLQILRGTDPNQIDFLTVMDQIEDYVNGKQRVELIKAIKDVNVAVYGAGHDRWKKVLAGQKNVTVHGPVSFAEAIKLMRQSKVVLNSRPSVKNGAHERIFSGIASGAAVLTNDNIYLHENFKGGQEILFYQNEEWSQLNEVVSEYVHNDKKRLEMVVKAQKIVKNAHTWDHRAATLISELGPILSNLYKP